MGWINLYFVFWQINIFAIYIFGQQIYIFVIFTTYRLYYNVCATYSHTYAMCVKHITLALVHVYTCTYCMYVYGMKCLQADSL